MNQNELYVKLLTEARIEVEGGEDFVCNIVKRIQRGPNRSASTAVLNPMLQDISDKIEGSATVGNFLCKDDEDEFPSAEEQQAFRLNMIDELIAKYEQNILFVKMLRVASEEVLQGKRFVCNIVKKLNREYFNYDKSYVRVEPLLDAISDKIGGAGVVEDYIGDQDDTRPEEAKAFRLNMIDELIESYGGK
jgi:hypothetical protein